MAGRRGLGGRTGNSSDTDDEYLLSTLCLWIWDKFIARTKERAESEMERKKWLLYYVPLWRNQGTVPDSSFGGSPVRRPARDDEINMLWDRNVEAGGGGEGSVNGK